MTPSETSPHSALPTIKEVNNKDDQKGVVVTGADVDEKKKMHHDQKNNKDDKKGMVVTKEDAEEKMKNKLIVRLVEDIEKQEERVLKLEATVFQLANYNFVFQGVILMPAINGSSTLTYRFVWFPFCLSLIATILNLATLIRLSTRYTVYLENLDNKIYIWYKNDNEFRKRDDEPRRLDDVLHTKNAKKKKQRKIAFYVSMTMFVAFSLVMATATAVLPRFHHTT